MQHNLYFPPATIRSIANLIPIKPKAPIINGGGYVEDELIRIKIFTNWMVGMVHLKNVISVVGIKVNFIQIKMKELSPLLKLEG